jgi:hypothetical protein
MLEDGNGWCGSRLGFGPLLVSLGRANWKAVHLVNTELRTKPLMFKVKEPSRTVLLQFRSNRQSGSKSRELTNITL